MQTQFSLERLADPHMQPLEKILRSCVHCGFCTATCPTYLVTGDERESPRGRIYLIKDLLETGRERHGRGRRADRPLLSCLSCMTTCPSGVDYRRLVDHARARSRRPTASVRRPPMRAALARLLPSRAAVSRSRWLWPRSAGFSRRSSRAFPASAPSSRRCWRWRPRRRPRAPARRRPANSRRRRRRQAAPRRAAHAAARRRCWRRRSTRRRSACSTAPASTSSCPRAKAAAARCCITWATRKRALAQVRANIDAWTREIDGAGLEAIVITASGCGATIKDYGYMLRDDPAYAEKAARVAALAKDVSEYVAGLELAFRHPEAARRRLPRRLLAAARPENPRTAQGAAAPRRLRSAQSRGSPYLLRLGGHLQYPAAGNGRGIAGAKSRQPRARQARRDRRRQHRLHRANRVGDRDAGRAYRRAAGLGERRADAGGAGVRRGFLKRRLAALRAGGASLSGARG